MIDWIVLSRTLYLADESLVADSLLCKLGRVESDLLLARVDHVGDLQVQHEVQLQQQHTSISISSDNLWPTNVGMSPVMKMSENNFICFDKNVPFIDKYSPSLSPASLHTQDKTCNWHKTSVQLSPGQWANINDIYKYM